ncbi:hypothetical protein [Ottowia testudinis]|uniref:Uncharacterized protein n=1 Tax=Ottowia testudinis TaxID=2816950 RepID=A0A975CGS1_9BURK|nr:hypothetical protein [Ottowia testudinis]QTD45492.1 hypothetical protein J1M35_00755 [Ottowia testudinis]
MSSFPSLSSLPPGLHVPAAGWDRARPASDGAAPGGSGDAAQVFGFAGDRQAARLLGVPAHSGDGAARLEQRFLDCLFKT